MVWIFPVKMTTGPYLELVISTMDERVIKILGAKGKAGAEERAEGCKKAFFV